VDLRQDPLRPRWLARRRLDRPYVRIDGKLEEASWPAAFAAVAARLGKVPGSRIAALAGDLADVEAMLALKELMTALGSLHLDCRQDGAKLDPPAAPAISSTHDRRHRAGRRLPADRHQSALGGAARQRPPAQAAPRRWLQDRGDRAQARPDLPGRPARPWLRGADDLAGGNHSWARC